MKAELEAVFGEKGDILKNQLTFKNCGMTFRHVQGRRRFRQELPVRPVPVPTVQKIFEAIRKAGATGLHLARGERSMLDAFQSAAQAGRPRSGRRRPGAAVRFYPSIESFLDTAVKKTIDQAEDNPSLEPFDIQLLQVLFLIRYVEEIKGNVDNLVTLCIDQIDADRLALRRRIEESLGRLEKETLISRNGDIYFFLTNEERDINREIKSVDLGSGEEAKLLGEIDLRRRAEGAAEAPLSASTRWTSTFNRLLRPAPGRQPGRWGLAGLGHHAAERRLRVVRQRQVHPGERHRGWPRPDPPGQRREPGAGAADVPPDREVRPAQERRHPAGVDASASCGTSPTTTRSAATGSSTLLGRDARRGRLLRRRASRSSSRRRRRWRPWTRPWNTSSRTRSPRWAT